MVKRFYRYERLVRYDGYDRHVGSEEPASVTYFSWKFRSSAS